MAADASLHASQVARSRIGQDHRVDTGREHEVVAAFVHWLRAEGWEVTTEVAWADIVAVRGEERLIAEAKGVTSSAVDTLYGQLLRRMAGGPSRYAVVVPDRLVPAVCRVSESVRARLGIEVYSVAMDDSVNRH